MMGQLGANFWLDEFLVTGHDLKAPLAPNPQQRDNLLRLVASVLQPLREMVKSPIRINSGFRSEELNSLVSGVPTSRHREGLAADIRVDGWSSRDVANALHMMNLPYRKIILYPTFVHVDIPRVNEKITRTNLRYNGSEYLRGLA